MEEDAEVDELQALRVKKRRKNKEGTKEALNTVSKSMTREETKVPPKERVETPKSMECLTMVFKEVAPKI